MNNLKVLEWDIETSHDVVAAFGLFHKQGIPPMNILQDWYIICGAWKWLDKKKVDAVSVLDDKERFEKDHTDDLHVIEILHACLSEADVLVHHFGDRFDIKKFNTRCLYHGLPPVKDLILVDTYKMAKKAFAFTSNRLDYIDRFLGGKGKRSTPTGLWLRVLKGDPLAIAEMVRYNKQDVVVLDRVYKQLRPYVKTKANYNVLDNFACPSCGSHHIHSRGTRSTTTRVYRSYQCQDCGSWSSSTISEKDNKAILK